MSEGPGLYRLYKGPGYHDFEEADVTEALADGWCDNPTDAEKQSVAPVPEPTPEPYKEMAAQIYTAEPVTEPTEIPHEIDATLINAPFDSSFQPKD